jgi:hypothetical protein
MYTLIFSQEALQIPVQTDGSFVNEYIVFLSLKVGLLNSNYVSFVLYCIVLYYIVLQVAPC